MVTKQSDDEVREIVGLLFPIDCDWPGQPRGRITQVELCEYHALRAEQARRSEELKARRAALIRRLADGVPIEEGPYRARIHACQARVLSTPKLLEILPEDEVEELRNRVTPSPRVELLVTFVDKDEGADGAD
jgi:hypothetical protein